MELNPEINDDINVQDDMEKAESRLRSMWDILKENKAAMIGLAIIILLVFIALFGRFIMPIILM